MPPGVFWTALGFAAILFALTSGFALIISQIPDEHLGEDDTNSEETST